MSEPILLKVFSVCSPLLWCSPNHHPWYDMKIIFHIHIIFKQVIVSSLVDRVKSLFLRWPCDHDRVI